MTDKEREEELAKSLADLRSRHNRLLMKYIELEDNYNDLKEKLDTIVEINKMRHANYTISEKYQVGSEKEEEIETAALTARGKRITEDI